MKYVLFLGYPIGVCNIGENTLFNVQKDNQIVGLGRYGYNIWKHTFKGIKFQDFRVFINSQCESYQKEAQNLISEGFLITLNLENMSKTFENIKNLKPIRQGIGGVVRDNYIQEVLLGNEIIDINTAEYIMWIKSTGDLTIEKISYELMKEFNISYEESKQSIGILLKELVGKGLIFLK